MTASDVAALLGVGRKSRMDVYLDKMGMAEHEATERMRWGLKLQRAILEEYAERTGEAIEFADPYLLVRHPQHPFLGATLDARRAGGDRRPVDAKNVGFKTHEWGDAGTDIIPHQYAVQLHVQMLVTDTQAADLAVLFGGNRYETFTVLRDPAVDDAIISAARQFWEDHIQKALPPAIDGSEAWTGFLQRFVRQRHADVRRATPDEEIAIGQLVEARAALDAVVREADRLENMVKAAIGPDKGIESDRARITWAQTAVVNRTDWKEVATALKQQVLSDYPAAAPTLDALEKKFTTTVPGPRRFIINPK